MDSTERKIIAAMSAALDYCDDKRYDRLRRELDTYRKKVGK